MIDAAELKRMRGRAEDARPTVDAVLVRRDGLYAGEPYEDPVALLETAVESVRDVPELIADCERLAPAVYLHGPEQCCEGDCEDEEPADGQWCSHVQERVAQLGHVKQAEFLRRLVVSLRRRLADGEDPNELVEAIDEALEEMAADDDIALLDQEARP